MNLSEVIDGLRTPNSYAGDMAVQGAITHLEPYTQPITPEGLEAAGFERCPGGMRRHVTRDISIAVGFEGGADIWTSGIVTRFPNVRSMGQVLGLVEMAEGGE